MLIDHSCRCVAEIFREDDERHSIHDRVTAQAGKLAKQLASPLRQHEGAARRAFTTSLHRRTIGGAEAGRTAVVRVRRRLAATALAMIRPRPAPAKAPGTGPVVR